MQVLAVDVGTGTQDIALFDSEQPVENSLKMVMPSPTVIVAHEIRAATAARQAVLFEGVTMGGGPCGWAASDHVGAGLAFYATPAAACTFDDDLSKVEQMGIKIVSGDEAARLQGVRRISSRDLNLSAILAALSSFQVEPRLDALAVAVFDHGAAPPDVSDRLYRFEYLREVVARGDLAEFAHPRGGIPEHLTRMRAVAQTADCQLPLLVMDTGPAAVLGCMEDERVAAARSVLAVNIGNFHTLAFHLVDGQVAGLFEHHTSKLTRDKLDDYLLRLATGELTNEEVFEDSGHGCLTTSATRVPPDVVAITGPRRGLIRGSKLAPYFAVPHGDMMIAGCFGLLKAMVRKMPQFAAAIEGRLS